MLFEWIKSKKPFDIINELQAYSKTIKKYLKL